MKKLVALLLALVMVAGLSLTACAAEEERYLGIVWPTMGVEFFSNFAELIKSQAEAIGWKAEITSYDFSTANQITQLENFESMGVTDIISIAFDKEGLIDVCKGLRERGIRVTFFSYAPNDLDAYDNVTVANQFNIGHAVGEVASDWVNAKYPDAADGSIKAVVIAMPTTNEEMDRDNGIKAGLAENSKIDVVKVYELAEDNEVAAQAAFENALLEFPDLQIVCTHYANFATAIDETAATYSLDRENFAIFSGDWDTPIAERVASSANGESLIRGLGAYDNLATQKQFDISRGLYDDQLNENKEFELSIMKVTPENVAEYLAQ